VREENTLAEREWFLEKRDRPSVPGSTDANPEEAGLQSGSSEVSRRSSLTKKRASQSQFVTHNPCSFTVRFQRSGTSVTSIVISMAYERFPAFPVISLVKMKIRGFRA